MEARYCGFDPIHQHFCFNCLTNEARDRKLSKYYFGVYALLLFLPLLGYGTIYSTGFLFRQFWPIDIFTGESCKGCL